MARTIKINPDRLVWARESVALSLEEMAKRVGVGVHIAEAWEDGVREPTFLQLTKLASTLLRTEAFFILPEDPEDEPSPAVSFRRFFDRTPSYAVLKEVEIAQARREDYLDLSSAIGEDIPLLPRDVLRAHAAKRTAHDIRNHLGVRSEDQVANGNLYHQHKLWIDAIESAGVLVFQCSNIGLEEFRGLAIDFDVAPVILLNGKDVVQARAFTLLHEFVHLWRGGNDFTLELDESDSAEERLSNQVAAELLMPQDLVDEHFSGDIGRLANKLGTSRLAMAYRLLELGHINRSEVRKVAGQSEKAKSSSGGNFYATNVRNVGRKYAHVVLEAMNLNVVSRHSAAELLRATKPGGLDKMYRALEGTRS